MAAPFPPKPVKGETIVVSIYGTARKVRVLKVHPFGTVDVVTLDGKNAYRVSGLAF